MPVENNGREINQQINQLLTELQGSDQERQLQAARFAGEQKIAPVVPVLIKLLESIIDPYETLPRQLMETTVWALGEIGDPQAIQPLIQVLNNPFYKIQANAVTALGQMEAEEAVEPLWQIVESTSAPQFVQLAAVEALGRIASQAAIAHLQELAENQEIPKMLQEKASQMLHYIQGFW
jgi:HEAT repeat protein